MVVFSIGKRLTEIELLEFVSRVVDLQGLNVTDNFLGFPEFLAIIAFIITVSLFQITFIAIDIYTSSRNFREEVRQVNKHCWSY